MKLKAAELAQYERDKEADQQRMYDAPPAASEAYH